MAAPSVEEKNLLVQFREKLTDLELSHDQNSDIFLLRWIRARGNNLDKAKDMLQKSLNWRKEFDTKSVLTWEPPLILQELLPIDATSWDKDNRPVAILPFGRWNLKKVVDSGFKDQSVRCACKMWEQLLFQMKGKTTKEGLPVTQCTTIIDMEGLGVRTIGSFGVMEAYKDMASLLDCNYPEVLGRAIIINAPKLFELLWAVTTPLLSQQTSNKIQIFTAASKWKPILLEAIDKEQLPEFYGGSRDSALHSFYKYTMKN